MSDIPKHVTHEQMRAAAEALGLNPSNVRHFQADAVDGVIVTVVPRDTNGRFIAVSGADFAIAHHIPIGYEPAKGDA